MRISRNFPDKFGLPFTGKFGATPGNHYVVKFMLLIERRQGEVLFMAENETKKATFGLDENIASVLCYILGWITGLIFYLVEKENKTVKFHALQSVYTFLPLSILYWIGGYIFWWTFVWNIIGMILGLLMFILWIVLMIKDYQGEKYKLPIVGDMAENATK
jgi:uncharacterized membrane protein